MESGPATFSASEALEAHARTLGKLPGDLDKREQQEAIQLASLAAIRGRTGGEP